MSQCEFCQTLTACGDPVERTAQEVAHFGEVGGCESVSVSVHSPAPVGNHELIHIVIVSPQQVLPDGALNPVIFKSALKNGLSCLRQDASDNEFAVTMDARRLENQDRQFHGCTCIPAGQLRFAGEERSVCIYDTGYKDRPHHADIMIPCEEKISGSQQKKVFKKLRDHIAPFFVPTNVFRDGRLVGI